MSESAAGRRPNILFMCVANSVRSQMAEGLARIIFGDKAHIQSAGAFAYDLHPVAVRVMGEIGIDISDQLSKSVDTINLSDIDIIVVLCKEQVCPPNTPKAKRYEWPMPDPSQPAKTDEERLKRFRDVRDELQKKIEELLKELGF
ncbi:MAG TPA: arsenate reductase ArsC [Bdellovibrionales bacterium]|nr:arsenate reductase ArsC [Bdellovibrionales bacterium]